MEEPNILSKEMKHVDETKNASNEDDLKSSELDAQEITSSDKDANTKTFDDQKTDAKADGSENDKPLRTCMPPPSGIQIPHAVHNKELSSENNPIPKIQDIDTIPKPKTTTEKPISARTTSAPPLPYKNPTWSGTISKEYKLEVVKSGVIVGNVELRDKSYIVFGRLECCDVVMEHPSISRYHTVVQYRAESDDQHPKGLYLYDLDSTHGTFLNKERIRARTYYRIRVGHMLKLGGSSRVFLLQGPPEDEENESELTVTQLKELRRKEEAEKIAMEMKQQLEDKKKADEGVDWGFGEDAEEDPLAENPFALSTANEDLYLDDPKKSLRGWFEREGYDLEYQVEEKGFGHFSCKILLPVDTGQSLYAEASVKGKKKEAVALCALEACRILDRYGLLRQSHHEGRKRKHKNWENDDFYDSDEDTYLDRTGTIEKKREFRKRLVHKEQVETYDSLIEKLNGVEDEIANIQNKLESSNTKAKQQESREQDSLEAFMTTIQSGDEIDKKTKSNLKLRLSMLQQDRTRLQKLANLAQPTSLPPLIKNVAAEGKKMVMVGSMKGGKKKTRLISSSIKTQIPTTVPRPVLPSNDDEMVVENDDDEEKKEDTGADNSQNGPPTVALTEIEPKEKIKTPKPAIEPKPALLLSSDDGSKSTEAQGNLSEASSKKRGKKRSGKWKKDIYDGTNPDYAMWLPPQDQTGDGITFLNEKFGY